MSSGSRRNSKSERQQKRKPKAKTMRTCDQGAVTDGIQKQNGTAKVRLSGKPRAPSQDVQVMEY